MRDLECLEKVFLAHLARARLDHRDGLAGTGDHQVKRGLLKLLQGGVDDEVVIDHADAHGTDGPMERQLAEHERG